MSSERCSLQQTIFLQNIITELFSGAKFRTKMKRNSDYDGLHLGRLHSTGTMHLVLQEWQQFNYVSLGNTITLER